MKRFLKNTLGISALLSWTLLLSPDTLLAVGESSDTNYSIIDVRNGGTISGVVTFSGEIPPAKEIKVNKDKKVCGNHKTEESLIVDTKTRGLKNVVLFLKDIKSGKKWALNENSLEIDQKGCLFSPHVLIVPVSREFNMLNNDGILHNVHTRSEINSEINKAQPKFLKRLKLSFEQPEFIKVTCDVHSWMQGWIVVANHPYYSITDDNGKFELTDVPPGTYMLEVWHESLGQQVKKVEVKAGDIFNLQITLKK